MEITSRRNAGFGAVICFVRRFFQGDEVVYRLLTSQNLERSQNQSRQQHRDLPRSFDVANIIANLIITQMIGSAPPAFPRGISGSVPEEIIKVIGTLLVLLLVALFSWKGLFFSLRKVCWNVDHVSVPF
jgi:hypothetical protein